MAQTLHTSQHGVSRQIRELEDELGVDIFARAGKRLTELTPPSEVLLPILERLLRDADNLRSVGADFQASAQGQLSIAATHSQARYALPPVVHAFRQRYPLVRLQLHQGSPKQVAEMLVSGEADIGVATKALASYDSLLTLPCYRWTHSVVLPRGHPLLQLTASLTLHDLAAFPIITYEQGYTGRAHIDDAFEGAGLRPDVVLSAMDADVIKTYVKLGMGMGMGMGIVALIAIDAERDRHLQALDAGHLFAVNVTRLGLRRGVWLRGYSYDFMEIFVPTLTRARVQAAMQAL